MYNLSRFGYNETAEKKSPVLVIKDIMAYPTAGII